MLLRHLLVLFLAPAASGCESLAARRTVTLEVHFVTVTPVVTTTHVVFSTEK